MRLSLLRMVQLILSSMDSDEVNSINDTTESRQVVDLIEQCWNEIVSQVDFPEMWGLLELESVLDINTPTVLRLPANVGKIEWLQYDYSSNPDEAREWRYVFPQERSIFLNRMNALSADDETVTRFVYNSGSGSFDIRVRNNVDPKFFTTFDNRTLLFDSYKKDRDTTLKSERTMCYGQTLPVFTREDEYIPLIEPKQQTLLFNEAKALCFAELKQMTNNKAERSARRGWTQAARKKNNTKASKIKSLYPDYGRK